MNEQERLITERGEEEDPDWIALRDLTLCPECRGTCEDKQGNPCERCWAEGEI